jgi:predicted nucleic acid-binding Zn ribbon protein
MSTDGNSVKCSDCDYEFSAAQQNEPERTPCPECGATSRTVAACVTEGVKIYDGLGYKIKDPSKTGKAKTKVEGFRKYVRSQLAPLVEHIREIDRVNDRYHETVRDAETGELIHSRTEPLSKHRGHGSAK